LGEKACKRNKFKPAERSAADRAARAAGNPPPGVVAENDDIEKAPDCRSEKKKENADEPVHTIKHSTGL
jgi:hypothetical protein